MSSLFSATPASSLPSFLTSAAPIAPPAGVSPVVTSAPVMAATSWSPTQTAQLLNLQQELMRIQAELDRLLQSLGAVATPPVTGVIGQAWQNLTNLFSSQPTPPPAAPLQPGKNGVTKFVLSSFNVLSSNAGNGKGYASGTSRMHGVEDILQANNVSVVGLQEVDSKQLTEFKKIAGDEYATFKGASGKPGYHDAVIAWRKAEWKKVDTGLLDVPSYGGRNSKVPYVRLRNRQTGQEAYFVNAHNPANTRRYHNQDRFRNEAARREAELVDRLVQQTGLPVFLVGDMNSVREAHQIITKNAPLKAANPPGKAGIDWIFGTKDAHFSKFRRDRGGLIGKTTDHPVVFTQVKLGHKK
ncbi:MAG: endonuclease/exonuclease/phosphatase family protein [Candidatus Sericytochromatia bacterium]